MVFISLLKLPPGLWVPNVGEIGHNLRSTSWLLFNFCSTITFQMKMNNLCLQIFPKPTKKDNFHNLIFGIDKRTVFDTFNPKSRR